MWNYWIVSNIDTICILPQHLANDATKKMTIPPPIDSSNKFISANQRNENDCIKEFGQIGDDSIPDLFVQIKSRMRVVFTNEKHWTKQIVDALADGYSTIARTRLLLQMDHNEYTLRDVLLIFHWYFRSVTECADEYTLEYRMRHMWKNDRTKCNFSIILI